MSTRRPAGAACLALSAALVAWLSGCAPPPAPASRAVEVQGEVRLPAGAGGPDTRVFVSFYQAWSLTGELRHPLQFIDSFETKPGPFSYRLSYPEDGGEGLVVYAWADFDGDGVLCTPSYRLDLAGLTEVAGFPADKVRTVVDLTEPCHGPDWFYPRPQPGG